MKATIRPGQRFGRLVVVIPRGRVTKKDGKQREDYSPLCLCDCGAWTSPQYGNLRSGNTTSCGACARRNRGYVVKKHPYFEKWKGMKSRCYNPNNPDYLDYGGRGITVCDRWRSSFAAFVEDLGERPTPAHTLGRIDNDGPYSPENCRWETRCEQANNTRRNRWVLWEGVRMTVTQASRVTGRSQVWCERNLQAAA